MPGLIDCLIAQKGKIDQSDVNTILDNRLKFIKDGMDELTAERKALAEHHKSLHENLNTLKEALGLPIDEYKEYIPTEKIAAVTKKYDKEQQKLETPKVEAAVIQVDGTIYEGKNHGEAIEKAKEAGEDVSKIDREKDGMFRTSDGRIITRDEAEKEFGARHSHELMPQEDAKESPKTEPYAEKTQGDQKAEGQDLLSPKSEVKPEPKGGGQEPPPSRQERINALIDLSDEYSRLRKNDSRKPGILNRIRLEANELGLNVRVKPGEYAIIENKQNKRVQRRSGSNKDKVEFDKSKYSQKTHDFVNGLTDTSIPLIGLDVENYDGRSMSENQKQKALDDIKSGKNTVGAKSMYDAIEKMVEQGYAEIKMDGRQMNIPIDEYMGIVSNPEPDISFTELNSMLSNDEYGQAFDNYINDFENDTRTEGEKVPEPTAGGTEPSAEVSASAQKVAGGGEKETPTAKAKSFSDKIRELADKVRNPKPVGTQGPVHRSAMDQLPRDIIAKALEYVANAIDAGKSALDALREAINFIKDNTDESNDKKIGEYLKAQMQAHAPELGDVFKEEPPKGLAVPKEATLFEKKPIKTGGGFKSKFVRGLSRLAAVERAMHTEQEALQSAYRASGSEGSARVVMNKIGDTMRKTFGKRGNEIYSNLRKVLTQSNLNGKRQRWTDWSIAFHEMTPDEMESWILDKDFAEENNLPEIQFITEKMENDPTNGKYFKGFTDAVNELIAKKDWETLKSVMAVNFNRAANLVNDLDWSGGKSYEEMRKDPDIQKAKSIYWKEFGQKVESAHDELGGSMTGYTGEENMYYPLVPVTEEGKGEVRKWFKSRNPFKKAATPYNDFATGWAKAYDTSVEGLTHRVLSAYKARDKNAMINEFKQQGYLVPFSPGDREDIINIGDDYLPATKININEGTGRRAAYYLIPSEIEKDVRSLLFQQKTTPTELLESIKKIPSFFNRLTLSTPMEAIRHSTNLLFRLNKYTPWAYDGNLFEKSAGSIPFVKQIMQMGHLVFMKPTSEKWLSVLDEMAAAGEVPKKFGQYTFNKEWSEMTGAEKQTWWKGQWGPLLYGTKGIDIRARMMLWSIAKGMNPNATPEQMRVVMSGLGDYNSLLQSEVVRMLKESSGLAPFIVSQQARLRAGVQAFNILPKYSAMPLEGLPLHKQALYHTLNMVQSSAYAYVGMWAGAFAAVVGSNPFTTPGARLGVIPFKKDDGTTVNINLGAFYQAANIGSKVLGMDAYFNSLAQEPGGFAGGFNNSDMQGVALEKGLIQSFNQTTAPVLSGSPVAHVAAGLGGVAPYLVSLNDKDGTPAIKFMPVSIPAQKTGEQFLINLANDAIHSQPLIGGAIDYTMRNTVGFSLQRDTPREFWKLPYYQSLLEAFFPGIFVQDVDLRQQEYYKYKDEQQQERAFQKEFYKQQE